MAFSASAANSHQLTCGTPRQASKSVVKRVQFNDITVEAGTIVRSDFTNESFNFQKLFTSTDGFQYGVASDGKYIYQSAWTYESSHKFYKYDLDGNLIEGFDFDGCPYLDDMTYDGKYFYGSNESDKIYGVDFENKKVVATITTDIESIAHISYDPENDGFWVGGWKDLALVDRDGKTKIESFTIPSTSGTAYYEDPNGREWLYLLGGNGDVCMYEIGQKSLYDDPVLSLNGTFPSFTDKSYGGGCEIATINGETIFLTVAQQAVDNMVGFYDLDTFMYEWTNDNPAIGLGAEGEGQYEFIALNAATSEAPVANITVKRYIYSIGEEIYDEDKHFTITVVPDLATSVQPVSDLKVKAGEKVEIDFTTIGNYLYDFNDGTSQGWTSIDADGDGYGWTNCSKEFTWFDGVDNSDAMVSSSWNYNTKKALTPDNYLVSPKSVHATEESSVSFSYRNDDNNKDHLGVAVAPDNTAGMPEPDDFELVWEGDAVKDWAQETVDLSKYAGKDIWIAFRHFNTIDEFYVVVDDVYISSDNLLGQSVWTTDNTNIGLEATGEGRLEFTAVNGTDEDQVANISVYPFRYVDDLQSGRAYGQPTTFRIVVEKGESGLTEISKDDTSDALYFTVSGIQVPADRLLPGIYLRLRGDKTDKVIVK